jgi:hypothetical protein
MEQGSPSPEPTPNLPARAPRHDGWTVERQTAFLKAFAACGTISAACRAVGMSRQSLHDLCARPSAIAFRRALDAARDCSSMLIEDAAAERTIHGVRRPIFYKGEQVGEWREHDERLTMFLLRYRRRNRFGPQLDHVPPPPPPPVDLPSDDFDEPDDDAAMGLLEWYLGDLTDYGDPPTFGAASSPRESNVNFVNFVGNEDGADGDGGDEGEGSDSSDE